MNTNTRKICQFCRYKHCIIIGMKSKWVLSDDERHQKYGNRRKQSRIASVAEPSDLMPPSPKEPKLTDSMSSMSKRTDTKRQSVESQSPEAMDSDDEMNSSNSSSKLNSSFSNDAENISIDHVDMRTHHLNSRERQLIDKLSMAFYHSRKYNALDLNVENKLKVLFETQSPQTLKKMSKVILANFIVQPVKRVITFAKLISDFRKLDIDDQMSLLQGGTMEIFICSSSSIYDHISNKFDNVVSKDRNIEGVDESNIKLDLMRLIWSEEIFLKTISFLKSIKELKIDEATLILFLPLILFSPDRRSLNDKPKVVELQSKYSFILKKYLIWKFGKTNALLLFPKLLLKLIELRSMHEMHSSILLDSDPTQLDPYPLALLTKMKEEAGPVTRPADDTTTSTETPETSEKKTAEVNSAYHSILTPDSLISGPNSAPPVSSVDSTAYTDSFASSFADSWVRPSLVFYFCFMAISATSGRTVSIFN